MSKRGIVSRLLGFTYVIAAGIGIAAIADEISRNPAVPLNAGLFLGMPIVLCGSYILTMWHELGHAVVAELVGWKVPLIAVGPVTLKFRPFRARYGVAISQGGGLTYLIPPDTEAIRGGHIAILCGGPIANLLLGVALMALATLASEASVVTRVAGVLGSLSFLMAISNFIPLTWPTGARSDGGKILDALRGQDLQRVTCQMRAMASVITGIRPRNWSPNIVRSLLDTTTNSSSADGWDHILMHSYYLDCNDLAKARIALDNAKDKLGPIEALLIDDAFLLAHGQSNFSAARKALDQVRTRSLRRCPTYFEAQALIALGEGDVAAASGAVSRARNALQGWPFAADGDREILETIESRIDSVRGQTSLVLAPL